MKWIDCNCIIGRCAKRSYLQLSTPEETKNLLLKNGISNAVVSHQLALDYHPIEGNMELFSCIHNDDFFIPAPVMLPLTCNDFWNRNEIERLFKKENIRFVRLYPALFNFTMDLWCIESLFELLNENQITVIIDYDQISLDQIHHILNQYKKLSIILGKCQFHMSRAIIPLLLKHQNLYIDISMYNLHYGIELLCKQIGSKQILFGSGFPQCHPGPCRYMVERAFLTNSDRENIAYLNLEKLARRNYD